MRRIVQPAAELAHRGTPASKGTKQFSLGGNHGLAAAHGQASMTPLQGITQQAQKDQPRQHAQLLPG